MATAHDATTVDARRSSDLADVVPSAPPIEAVLLGTNDDTRLLLRGLIRLHRHRVALEARSVEELEELAPSSRPRVLLQDVDAEDDRWSDELKIALERFPDLRAIVLLPTDGTSLRAEALRAGASAVIVRPFAVRELIRKVVEVVDDPGPRARPPPGQP